MSEPQVQLLNLNSIDLRELEEKVAGQPLTSYFPPKGIREIILLHGFCWDSKCWFFSIFFCWNSSIAFFCRRNFYVNQISFWIPNCWEARCSNSQNQSTKPCRRGLHGPVLGAVFSRHRPEVSHPVGWWFERHALQRQITSKFFDSFLLHYIDCISYILNILNIGESWHTESLFIILNNLEDSPYINYVLAFSDGQLV